MRFYLFHLVLLKCIIQNISQNIWCVLLMSAGVYSVLYYWYFLSDSIIVFSAMATVHIYLVAFCMQKYLRLIWSDNSSCVIDSNLILK